MRNGTKRIGRIVLALLYLGWGVVNVVYGVSDLQGFKVIPIVSVALGLVMAAAGLLGLFHRCVATCRLLTTSLFGVSGLMFAVTLLWHLLNPGVAVSWGSLVTAFLAALYLSML